MGMPTYGKSFTLWSSANHGFNAGGGAGAAGPLTKTAGMLSYAEICKFVKHEGWTVVGPTDKVGPYAYKGNQWVGYDDEATIRRKVNISLFLHFRPSLKVFSTD